MVVFQVSLIYIGSQMETKIPLYLMCHGEAEKIFLLNVLNNYNWNRESKLIINAILPDSKMNISSTQTTNIFENISKFFRKHKKI